MPWPALLAILLCFSFCLFLHVWVLADQTQVSFISNMIQKILSSHIVKILSSYMWVGFSRSLASLLTILLCFSFFWFLHVGVLPEQTQVSFICNMIKKIVISHTVK